MAEIGIRKFEEMELKRATNDYAIANRLGEGGFGSVYRGVLNDGRLVAIKKSKGWKAKAKQNFINEMRNVAQVNHKNIVKIIGMCLETQSKVPLLVYEFVSNRTLYFHINNKSSGVLKSWKTRLRIASEMAEAVNYLHSSAKPPIIHGDIKSTNILLDDQNTAKVADFGGSILTSQKQLEEVHKGTLGYMDPEYESTKKLTEKSDVYSFGVVLVELLTGKTPSLTSSSKDGEAERDLIKEFISAVEQKRIIQLLDEELTDDVDTNQIEQVAGLVKECLNKIGQDRPTMKDVVARLESLKGHSKNTDVLPKETEETEGLTQVAEVGSST